MQKLDELTEEHGYDEAKRLHKIWLSAIEDNKKFYDMMTTSDREQFDYIFGGLEIK